jgi:hypothetical protein
MSPDELARLKRFVYAGNGTGDGLLNELADQARRGSLNEQKARVVLDFDYADAVHRATCSLLESWRSEEAYYGYCCRFLAEKIEDPGFDSETADLATLVNAAGEQAFDLVHDDNYEFMKSCLNEVGSDLEQRVG